MPVPNGTPGERRINTRLRGRARAESAQKLGAVDAASTAGLRSQVGRNAGGSVFESVCACLGSGTVRGFMRKNVSECSVSYYMLIYTAYFYINPIKPKLAKLLFPQTPIEINKDAINAVQTYTQSTIFDPIFALHLSVIFIWLVASVYDNMGSILGQKNTLISRKKKQQAFGYFTATIFALIMVALTIKELSSQVLAVFKSRQSVHAIYDLFFDKGQSEIEQRGIDLITKMSFLAAPGLYVASICYFASTCRFGKEDFPIAFKTSFVTATMVLLAYVSQSPIAVFFNFALNLALFIAFGQLSLRVLRSSFASTMLTAAKFALFTTVPAYLAVLGYAFWSHGLANWHAQWRGLANAAAIALVLCAALFCMPSSRVISKSTKKKSK